MHEEAKKIVYRYLIILLLKNRTNETIAEIYPCHTDVYGRNDSMGAGY